MYLLILRICLLIFRVGSLFSVGGVMELSRFSKQFRVLGGGALLALAYSPMLIKAYPDKGISTETVVARNESILSQKPIFHAKLTDSLKLGYFDEVGPACFNISNFESRYIADTADENGASPAQPLRFTEIKSGPYKGGKLVKGIIQNNFYVDARKLAIPVNVIDKVIKSLSSKIDFRRSLKKGDKFEIAFSNKKELIYSKIKTKRKQAAVYKFGKEGYFLEDGTKVGTGRSTKAFAPPIKGRLRISSPFGSRIHPVTRVRKTHYGVDLMARHGTPVYAVYDGVVTRASWYSGYGKCICLRHANGYTSLYGHLSRLVTRVGAKIKKGQLIAYSGSTGVATGPHLHLELARNHVRLNPMNVRMMEEKPKRISNRFKFSSLKNYFKNLSNSVK